MKSNRLGEDKEEFSESASVAGARSSYGGASMGQSRKGSMFDVGLESGRSPIPEEEGSLQDNQDCKSLLILSQYCVITNLKVYFLFVANFFM